MKKYILLLACCLPLSLLFSACTSREEVAPQIIEPMPAIGHEHHGQYPDVTRLGNTVLYTILDDASHSVDQYKLYYCNLCAEKYWIEYEDLEMAIETHEIEDGRCVCGYQPE